MSDKIERIIDALRKKILESAIRGELVPQNPEDEPASKLLERIAEERERLIKEKKIKKPKSSSCIFRRDGHFYESINGGEPTCIDEEIPFEIPNSWEWVRGMSIFEATRNIVPQKDFSYIDIDAIDNKRHIIKSGKPTKKEKAPSRARRLLEPGDVLFSLVRPYLENIALVENQYANAIASTGFYVVRSRVLFPGFAYILFLSPYVLQGLNAFMKGDNSPSIRSENIEDFLYPIPPLSEQQEIVKAFNEVEYKLDTLQQSRQHYKRILSETPTSLRQQLVQSAIQGQLIPQNPNDEPASVLLERVAQERALKLGKKAAKSMSRIERRGSKTYELFPDGSEKDISDEIPFDIPRSWEWARLSTLLECCSTGPFGSMLHKSDYVDFPKGIPLINPTNIKEGIICSLGIQKVSKEKADCLAKYRLKEGDIILARRGDLSKCAVITKAESKWLCGTGSFFLHLTMIENAYFCCVYSSQYTQSILLGDSVGSTMQNLNQSVLNNLLMPIPPLQEQHRIVEKLDALLKLV